jgi:hypothetical protein
VARPSHRVILRFVGGGIAPQTVSAGELAQVISSLENSIAEVMGLDPRERLVLSLVQITHQSDGLVFACPTKKAADAFYRIAKATKKGDISTLPVAAREAPRQVLQFIRRRNCAAEWRGRGRHPIAVMTPKTQLNEVPDTVLRGETTLYGYVVRVGGEDPVVRLRYSDREPAISCTVTETLARDVAKKLYSWVGLSGTAEWNRRDNSLVEFHATGLLPFDGSPAATALAELGDLIGEYWQDADPDAVSRIRGLADQ